MWLEICRSLYSAIEEYIRNPWAYAEGHRKNISDVEWARMQPKDQNYYVGDVIEFIVGGVGLINKVNFNPHGGWPPSYSTARIKGEKYREDGKVAWHYEGDFKRLVAPSGVRKIIEADK